MSGFFDWDDDDVGGWVDDEESWLEVLGAALWALLALAALIGFLLIVAPS